MNETIDLCGDSDSSDDADEKKVSALGSINKSCDDSDSDGSLFRSPANYRSTGNTMKDLEDSQICHDTYESYQSRSSEEFLLSMDSLGSSSRQLGYMKINNDFTIQTSQNTKGSQSQKEVETIDLLDSSDEEESTIQNLETNIGSKVTRNTRHRTPQKLKEVNESLDTDDEIFGFEAFKKRNTKQIDSTIISPAIAHSEKRRKHDSDSEVEILDQLDDKPVVSRVSASTSSSQSRNTDKNANQSPRLNVQDHHILDVKHFNASINDSLHISFDGGFFSPTSASNQGRQSVGSISVGNVLRRKVPVPAIPRVDINAIGGKLYPDLRNHFIRTLIVHAKDMRRDYYNRGKLDASIRAIIALSQYPYPIRSPEAAAHYAPGVGDVLLKIFKEAPKVGRNNQPYNPPNGLYSCAAAGALVALLDHESSGEEPCSMEMLLQRVNSNTHNTSSKGGPLFDKSFDYYLEKENQDISWMQINKLCSSLIKKRRRKTASLSGIVLELTEEGRQEAMKIRRRGSGPLPPGPLRQLAADSVDEEFENITISMDYREGGGGTNKLHEMCKYFDDQKVPYVVRDLKIADYIFFIGDKLAPVIIERKTLEDVAKSLVDGRWERQQRNMRKAQYILGGANRKCHLCYIIEGDIDRVTVHGGYVGRRADGVTREQVQGAIEALPRVGFSVITAKTKSGSLGKIVQMAKEFLWRANNRSFDLTHTYAEFVRDVNALSDSFGDPPTDPIHMNPAPPIIDHVARAVVVDTNSESVRAQKEELMKLSMQELKDKCNERCEKMSGSRAELVDRLLQPRKPEILITKARRNQYVPKVPSSNAAILVALLLHQEQDKFLSKEEVMNFAEETCISKQPMHGNGKSFYNGWSGIKDLTIPSEGCPALVNIRKRKGYALATEPYGESGVDVARAIHVVAHRQGICRCGEVVDIS